ncbi:ClC family H(+)/Cl(-) exchange transporter [Oceanivirga miroungae]|nr:ClC family H(+)/Cl(-) exchange transporter [Oceanivirga miroungae]
MKRSIFASIGDVNKLKSNKTRLKLILFSIIIGFLTGIVVVLYRVSLDKIVIIRNEIMGFNIGLLLFLFFISAIIIQFLLNKFPLISGSGIPQVEGVLNRQITFNWFFEIVNKFFAGVLAIFMGLSLGREGPSIHLGALMADGVNSTSNRPDVERKYLLSSGASAGLAAAFNAPLSGTIFALEELKKFFSPILLICTLLASISSNLVVQYFLGRNVVLSHFITANPMGNTIKDISFEIFLVLILSFFMAISAKLFNYCLIKSLNIYRDIKLNKYIKMIIVSIISFFAVYFMPDITGGGHSLIEKLILSQTAFKVVILLLLFKFIFTMFSYSTGAAGGIFLPLLVLGALIGKVYGIVIVNLFNLSDAYLIHFMLLSMAAYFSAIVKAPITGIVLILEMTGNFSNLFSLTIAAAFSYIISDLIKNEGVYDLLYHRMFEKNLKEYENDEEIKPSNKMTAIRLAVIENSKLAGMFIKDVNWPKNMLVIGIERNNYEFIPDGNTKIYEGDQIIIFADDNIVVKKLHELFEMTREDVK